MSGCLPPAKEIVLSVHVVVEVGDGVSITRADHAQRNGGVLQGLRVGVDLEELPEAALGSGVLDDPYLLGGNCRQLVEARIARHEAAVVGHELEGLLIQGAHVGSVPAAGRILEDLDFHVQAGNGEITSIGVQYLARLLGLC